MSEHNIIKYGGKDSTHHWDTCSTCDSKLNIEAHIPDRETSHGTGPVKCIKCEFLIAPAKQGKGLSNKAVAGIVIGSISAVVLGGFIIWLRLRKMPLKIRK